MAIPSPLERSNWAHSMLEKYAAWVPANLDRIRANARIISTNDDPKSWKTVVFRQSIRQTFPKVSTPWISKREMCLLGPPIYRR